MKLDPISSPQRELISKLYGEIDPEFGAARAAKFFATFPNRGEASAKIDTLIAASRKAKAERREAERREVGARLAAAAGAATSTVVFPAPAPARAERPQLVFPEPGYYAVHYQGVLRFYRVKVATKGYYAGRSFLDRFKSDELRQISYAEKVAALDAINANPAEAGMRFAVELTRCMCCGRMLTDEDSRLRGVGPDCFGRRQNGRDAIGFRLADAAV